MIHALRTCQQKKEKKRDREKKQMRVRTRYMQKRYSERNCPSAPRKMLPDPGFEAHADSYTGEGLVTPLLVSPLGWLRS
jgi:hypothetical protein